MEKLCDALSLLVLVSGKETQVIWSRAYSELRRIVVVFSQSSITHVMYPFCV